VLPKPRTDTPARIATAETVYYLEPRPTSLPALIDSIAICHAAGLIGLLTSGGNMRSRWYLSLNKPVQPAYPDHLRKRNLLRSQGVHDTAGGATHGRAKVARVPGNESKVNAMRFFAYVLGFLILIAGLAWAAMEAGAPTLYVQIGAVILLGLGIIMGASRTRSYRPDSNVTVVRDKDHL
jgi:hypothetical protein